MALIPSPYAHTLCMCVCVRMILCCTFCMLSREPKPGNREAEPMFCFLIQVEVLRACTGCKSGSHVRKRPSSGSPCFHSSVKDGTLHLPPCTVYFGKGSVWSCSRHIKPGTAPATRVPWSVWSISRITQPFSLRGLVA